MRRTSLEAYAQILDSLHNKRAAILNEIRRCRDGVCLFELVKIIGRPVNEISGRVTELARLGLIEDTGRKLNPDTNKRATIWKVSQRGMEAYREKVCS